MPDALLPHARGQRHGTARRQAPRADSSHLLSPVARFLCSFIALLPASSLLVPAPTRGCHSGAAPDACRLAYASAWLRAA
jgi:hypothetical protein